VRAGLHSTLNEGLKEGGGVVDATSNDRRQSKGAAEPQLEVGEVPTAGPHLSALGEEE
jgi:hypothetical protein